MIPDIVNFIVIIFYLETTILEGYEAFAYCNLMERLESKGNTKSYKCRVHMEMASD